MILKPLKKVATENIGIPNIWSWGKNEALWTMIAWMSAGAAYDRFVSYKKKNATYLQIKIATGM